MPVYEPIKQGESFPQIEERILRRWKELGVFEINWGHGSSPALYEDLVILLCDHEPGSYLVALDKATGKERWKVAREKGSISYSTPTVVRGPRGEEAGEVQAREIC